jgi:hypothetical protein
MKRQGCYICANFIEEDICKAGFDEKGFAKFCIKDMDDCLTCQRCTCKSFRLKNNISNK